MSPTPTEPNILVWLVLGSIGFAFVFAASLVTLAGLMLSSVINAEEREQGIQ